MMNYVKGLILNIITLSLITLTIKMGNVFRVFRPNERSLYLAFSLVGVLFLAASIAFTIYYISALKYANQDFSNVKQTQLRKYFKASLIIFGVFDVISVAIAVIMSFFIEEYSWFCLPTTLISVVLFAATFCVVMMSCQPKGVYFDLK